MLVDKCSENKTNYNRKKVVENFDKLKTEWEKSKRIFSLLILDSKINELDSELENIEIYITNNDYRELEKLTHMFKEKLSQISENEKINIENIF